MVVVSLVREGIDKHKARELADHFATQPEQEPVAFYHPHKGFHWAKPTHISAPTVVDVPPVPLYAAPPAPQSAQPMHPDIKKMYEDYFDKCFRESFAPQRPWVNLTDDDRFEIAAEQHGWEDLLIAAEARLKEKNNG